MKIKIKNKIKKKLSLLFVNLTEGVQEDYVIKWDKSYYPKNLVLLSD